MRETVKIYPIKMSQYITFTVSCFLSHEIQMLQN